MAYIETETNEPVTYSDSGPGGSGGCENRPKRPKDPETAQLKPIDREDPTPHFDPVVEGGAYICFYAEDGEGDPLAITGNAIKSKYSLVTLKPDYTTEIDDEYLVSNMLKTLELETVQEYVEKHIQRSSGSD